MSEQTSGKAVLEEGDFTKVKDADGTVQEHPVPKAWVGTDLLPQGWKAATAKDEGKSAS